MLNNKLIKELKGIFLDKVSEYESKKEAVRGYYNNEFSCQQGCISQLIYYYQTVGIFKKYPFETIEAITEIEVMLGYTVGAEEAEAEQRVNYYIWVIFEYFCNEWITEIEEQAEQEEEQE